MSEVAVAIKDLRGCSPRPCGDTVLSASHLPSYLLIIDVVFVHFTFVVLPNRILLPLYLPLFVVSSRRRHCSFAPTVKTMCDDTVLCAPLPPSLLVVVRRTFSCSPEPRRRPSVLPFGFPVLLFLLKQKYSDHRRLRQRSTSTNRNEDMR